MLDEVTALFHVRDQKMVQMVMTFSESLCQGVKPAMSVLNNLVKLWIYLFIIV